ncbi:flagellin FliC [bacterium]|nr:flagellin FliC [bacterium]MBU1073771.1 flagellin FliC [bacterium]MBU1674898.1 flagellin FliC [bacterium]
MTLRINTNVASLNAQRNLYNTTMKLNKSLERLSSGLRINRAGDDAAGLAISESLKSDIRALEQSSRNAADGISMVQVAEGAMSEVSDILIRMRELAQQAANETLGASERGYLDDEFQTLEAEINRISDFTEFNGSNLLDGTDTAAREIQVGLVATDVITIDFTDDIDSTGLGINADVLTGADNTNASAAIANIEAAISDLSSYRAGYGASQNRLESAVRSINNAVENLSAANSRIRDVDIAAETSSMTSYQILQQAGVSVLMQANMTPQMALMLLQ